MYFSHFFPESSVEGGNVSLLLERCHNANEPIPPVTKKKKIVPIILDKSFYAPQKPFQQPEPPGEESQLVTQTCTTVSAASALKERIKPVCAIAPLLTNRVSFNRHGHRNNSVQKPFPIQSTYGHSESCFSQPHYPMTYEHMSSGGQRNISPPNMWNETYSGNFYNSAHECGLSSYPVFSAQQNYLYETQNIHTQCNFEAQPLLPPIPSTPDPVPFPQFNVPPPNISQCMVSTMNTTSQGQVTYPINVESQISSSTYSICKEDSKSIDVVLNTAYFMNIFPYITAKEFRQIVSQCGSVKGYQFHQCDHGMPSELQECLTDYTF